MAPLIVITGPTASGKTGLALELAERHNGQIICADSRTIYKGMDIGTAKPTKAEQARVVHRMVDIVEPGQRYSVADFQTEAYRHIDTIRKSGSVPFVVGGTGLYIDSVVLEYEWPEYPEHDERRTQYEDFTVDALQQLLKEQQLTMPTNDRNKRHLINELLRGGAKGRARSLPRDNTHVVAIATDMDILVERIRARAQQMFEDGVVEETKRLGERYGWGGEAMKSNIYPIVKRMIDGHISKAQAIELFTTRDRQLAKRQITWLKRHDHVHWLSLDEARSYIETTLI